MTTASPMLKKIKVEEWDGSTACIICTETLRVPGGEPDALQCKVCVSAVYHRACAGKWTETCPVCEKNTIMCWTRPAPPGPHDEVIVVRDSEDESERMPLDRFDIAKMNLKQLQDALRTRKLEVSGRKFQLIERLQAFLNEENERGGAVRRFTSGREPSSEIPVEQNSIENDGQPRRAGH